MRAPHFTRYRLAKKSNSLVWFFFNCLSIAVHACILSRFSHVWLCDPRTAACQAPCLRDSSGKNTGVGWCFLLQGIFLANPGVESRSFTSNLHWQAGFFTTSATWEVPKHSCWTQNSIWFCLEAPSDFPGGSDGKESAHNARDLGSTPGLRRSLKGEHGNPLQHSCWRIPMDREAWLATVYGVTKSQTWLSD